MASGQTGANLPTGLLRKQYHKNCVNLNLGFSKMKFKFRQTEFYRTVF